MNFNKACEQMGIVFPDVEGTFRYTHNTPALEEITPIKSFTVPVGNLFDDLKHQIVHWGNRHMPGAPILGMVTDLEDSNIEGNMKELLAIIDGLSDVRKTSAVAKSKTAYESISRDMVERYFLELVKTKLMEGNLALNLDLHQVHDLWFSTVIDSAMRNYRHCNFGEITLPPINQHFMNLSEHKLNRIKRKIFNEQLELAIRATLNFLWRDISRIVFNVVDIIKQDPAHSPWCYYDIKRFGNTIEIINYGDMRILKYNIANGVYDAN